MSPWNHEIGSSESIRTAVVQVCCYMTQQLSSLLTRKKLRPVKLFSNLCRIVAQCVIRVQRGFVSTYSATIRSPENSRTALTEHLGEHDKITVFCDFCEIIHSYFKININSYIINVTMIQRGGLILVLLR